MISIDQLQQQGGFVDETPVEKTIQWKPPGAKKAVSSTIMVARQSFGEVEESLNDVAERRGGAQMISMCVRLGADGKERLSYEQAYNLHPSLAWAMVKAINEVNSAPKT